MSERLAELLKIAAAVQRAESEEFKAKIEEGGEVAAANRQALRAVIGGYFDLLIPMLGDSGLPAEALAPLKWLDEQLSAIDGFGAEPAVFKGGKALGLTKPMRRLHAEGHAAGCVAYAHEVVGLPVMVSCDAVAGLFSIVGHSGRIKERRDGTNGKLSGKTVYQWYLETTGWPDGTDLSWTLRWAARGSAMDALREAERKESTADWPQEDARTRLAERIAQVAAGTRVGAPDGPKVAFEPVSESTR